MGREIKRVALDFDWPLNEIWPGRYFSLCGEMENYNEKLTSEQTCEKCRKYAKIMGWKIENTNCPDLPFAEPPKGDGYQLWETVSEGSPISPVFKEPKELAQWLVDNDTSITRDTNFEGWMKFITSSGWAPSMVVEGGKIKSGVKTVVSKSQNKEVIK